MSNCAHVEVRCLECGETMTAIDNGAALLERARRIAAEAGNDYGAQQWLKGVEWVMHHPERAAPAPQPAPPPLDVERLARAMARANGQDANHTAEQAEEHWRSDLPDATRYAAEYARLAEPRATPETLPPANPALMGTIQRGRKDRPPEAER